MGFGKSVAARTVALAMAQHGKRVVVCRQDGPYLLHADGSETKLEPEPLARRIAALKAMEAQPKPAPLTKDRYGTI